MNPSLEPTSEELTIQDDGESKTTQKSRGGQKAKLQTDLLHVAIVDIYCSLKSMIGKYGNKSQQLQQKKQQN